MTYNEYANLFLENSGANCTMHMSGGNDYRFKVYYPWEYGQTIPDSVTTLTPRLILNPLYGFDGFLCEMSTNHAFIMIPRWESPTYETHLCWIPIKNEGETIHYLPGDWGYGMAAISDNEVYIIINDYVEDVHDLICLQKVTFTDSGATAETVYSWENFDTYGSSTYQWWDSIHTLHIKYEGYDCIYFFANYILDEGGGQEYICRSIVYNIESGQVYDNWVNLFDYNADIYSLYYQHTTAGIYNNMVVFGVCCDFGYEDDPGPPYTDISQIAFVMVDIRDGSVTILDDIKKPWDYWSISGGAIDNTDHRYYFSAWYEGDDSDSIYFVDLDNPTAIIDTTIHLSLALSGETYDQGPNHGYLFDEPSASLMPSSAPIYEYPNLNYIDDIYLSLVKGYGSGGALYREIDMDNNMIWNLQLDKLEGKSLDGGVDRDIPINPPLSFLYPIGGPPFYNWNRMAYLRILDGKCIVLIYSTTDAPYEYDHRWYLLE
jgi:hypothetical protein